MINGYGSTVTVGNATMPVEWVVDNIAARNQGPRPWCITPNEARVLRGLSPYLGSTLATWNTEATEPPEPPLRAKWWGHRLRLWVAEFLAATWREFLEVL